jgi:hypothetical protein
MGILQISRRGLSHVAVRFKLVALVAAVKESESKEVKRVLWASNSFDLITKTIDAGLTFDSGHHHSS